jgi:hypothetical protein
MATLATQALPFSRLNERCPEERMAPVTAPPNHSQLHLPQSLTPSLPLLERLVIWDHQVFRRFVRDRPEADDLALGSGQHQRAAQSLHAFAVLHISHNRIAGRKHYQFGPRQVQGRRFQCGQDAVVIAALAMIGAGQREARAQQRVLTWAANQLSRRSDGGFVEDCEFAGEVVTDVGLAGFLYVPETISTGSVKSPCGGS